MRVGGERKALCAEEPIVTTRTGSMGLRSVEAEGLTHSLGEESAGSNATLMLVGRADIFEVLQLPIIFLRTL